MRKLISTLVLCTSLFFIPSVESARQFYIDFFDGDDANDGLSTNAPWKRSPQMNGFAGSYSYSATDDFKYRGGVTWDNTCMPWVEKSAGLSTDWRMHFSTNDWYLGDSWSHAIFDGEGVDLTTRTQTVSSAKNVLVYTTRNSNISPGPGSANYIWVQGIQAQGMLYTNQNNSVQVNGWTFLSYEVKDIVYTNCIARDWVIRDSYASDCCGFFAFNDVHPKTNVIATHCTVIGPSSYDPAYVTDEQDPGETFWTSGSAFQAFTIIEYCTATLTTAGAFGARHTRNNHFYILGDSYRGDSHENGAWINAGMFYNNRLYGVVEGVGAYFLPAWSANANGKCLVFNNSFYDLPQINLSNQKATAGNTVEMHFFNNMIRRGVLVGTGKTGEPFWKCTVANNIFVTDQSFDQMITYPGGIDEAGTNYVSEPNLFYTTADAATLGLAEVSYWLPVTPWTAMAGTGITLTQVWADFATYAGFDTHVDKDYYGNQRTAGAVDIGPVQFTGVEEGDTLPAFTIHPQDTTVQDGHVVIFVAAAIGEPVPTYQWYRGGSAIVGATSPAYQFTVSLSDDQAAFFVRATNSEGSTDSNPATLTVTSNPVTPPEVISEGHRYSGKKKKK
jgi:hypothetical protein